jgi:hypothetical protein
MHDQAFTVCHQQHHISNIDTPDHCNCSPFTVYTKLGGLPFE